FDETPRMDALARAGVRFSQAYAAAPVCSPTRASLWTGKSPARLGITNFIPGDPAAARPLVTPPGLNALPLAELTVAEALAAEGYETFYAGKWHLGEGGFAPDAQGFARYVSARSLGNAGDDWRVSERLTDSAEAFIDGRDPARPFFMVLAYQEPHVPILSYPAHI